jgi:CelD/BcsL family acetyltransferase involved in cellulose biosynthesis
MLQTGFAQEDDNVRRSGFVSHCLAMQYNSTHGVDVYDYMCGDAEYKKVLGEMQPALVWGVFQRKGLRPCIENLFVAIFRLIKPRRQSSSTYRT